MCLHGLGRVSAHSLFQTLESSAISKRLGKGDISEEQARNSSCLDRKHYTQAFKAITNVIETNDASSSPSRKQEVDFKDLIYKLGLKDYIFVTFREMREKMEKKSGFLSIYTQATLLRWIVLTAKVMRFAIHNLSVTDGFIGAECRRYRLCTLDVWYSSKSDSGRLSEADDQIRSGL